ncbi:MAG: ABC transporter permease [Saprospiraceae bacterium]|nr:ABC transporter permease [Saprospiraceae bacterium]
MLFNYIKIGFRNLVKHKLFSLTNIVGLSIGVLCCLMILMYVSHEISYDRWNPKLERIVRPYGDINFGGMLMRMAVSGSVVAPDAAEVLPEIEDWCRFRDYGSYLVREDGTDHLNLLVEDALSVDSTFFNLFPIEVILGDPETCLTQPKSLAISENLAKKLFGTVENVTGKNLLLSDRDIWSIKGVFANIPVTNHFKADMLLSLNGNEEIATSPSFWASNNNFHTYLLLKEGTDYNSFSEKFENLSREKVSLTARTLLNMSLEDFEKTGQHARYPLQRLKDIHLHSDLQVELSTNGDIRYIWIFSTVALFVLLIACINFMNLTTAKSSQRAKEIAVRKVLGSKRKQLVYQFLSESIIMAFFAFGLAILFSILLKPWYATLTGAALQLPWSSPIFWLTLVGGIFLVGILAGSYPAFFLSAFKPLQIMRDSGHGKSRDHILRNTLVVFQFIIATSLIIGTFLIYQQLNFIRTKKLGFQQDQVVVVDDTYTLRNNIESFKQQILLDPAVTSASISSYLPIPSSRSNSTYSKIREFREDQAINMGVWSVDYDYGKTYNLQLKEGRFFDQQYGGDSMGVILNEAAIKILGYEDPVGKKIYGTGDFQGAPKPEDFIEYTIVGVVEDFHYESLREKIGALGLFLERSTGSVSVAYQAGSTDKVISHLESIWQKMAPSQPFAYRFVDEAFGKMYESEKRVGKITLVFAALAIIVSCLGLFGLSTFVVEQRTKEIGIRKVLGANIANIVGLLSRQFLLLVLLGIIVAIPLTWYFLRGWLESFAYRIEISWVVFLMASVIALLIAFLTVGSQSLKAAIMNPVKALRSE